jgi:HSP20 family protein
VLVKNLHSNKKEKKMALMRRQEVWDPFRELEEISNRFTRLFEMAKWPGDGERETLAKAGWFPPCEISEGEKEYRIRLELPDVNKDDVQVTLEDGLLSIQGERKEEKDEKGRKYHRRELKYGSFLRQFTMPNDIDEAKVDASFKNGILNVTVGRTATKRAATKEIAIH